jgi:hypothetical protein
MVARQGGGVPGDEGNMVELLIVVVIGVVVISAAATLGPAWDLRRHCSSWSPA